MKKCDASMTMAVHDYDYRENPTNPALFLKNSKIIRMDLANKNAYIAFFCAWFFSAGTNSSYIEPFTFYVLYKINCCKKIKLFESKITKYHGFCNKNVLQ